jgi:hypothetical protein
VRADQLPFGKFAMLFTGGDDHSIPPRLIFITSALVPCTSVSAKMKRN